MPARTGTASLIGASWRTTGGEAVSPGTWAAVAGSGSGWAGARAVAAAGELRTGAVAGMASGPSGIGTNAGAEGTGGRVGAACCCGCGEVVGDDVSGACEPVPGTACAVTGVRMVVTTVGATGAAATGVE
ncbi:MAG: hypothetical protein QOD67_3868, partial [Caballeronia sp.]|nr:hypothetical protein [Caballeronia sp.]